MAKKTLEGGVSRWWDMVSHHPLWAALIAALLTAAIVAHSGGVFNDAGASPEDHHPNTRIKDGQLLRVTWTPVATENFAVLFHHYIPVPKESEAWESLHTRGGVDVTQSNFRLTLANISNVPVTITGIEAVVRASRPRPTGSEARVYTQGTEGLEEFGVLLQDAAPGSTAVFHHTPHGEFVEFADQGPPFFSDHRISLAPNEIYEAKVAVQVSLSKEIEYGFAIRGNTAQHGFTYKPQTRFKIAGFNLHEFEIAHVYWRVPKTSGQHWCWIHAYKARYEPECP